jgi:hypothetical protein
MVVDQPQFADFKKQNKEKKEIDFIFFLSARYPLVTRRDIIKISCSPVM